MAPARRCRSRVGSPNATLVSIVVASDLARFDARTDPHSSRRTAPIAPDRGRSCAVIAAGVAQIDAPKTDDRSRHGHADRILFESRPAVVARWAR